MDTTLDDYLRDINFLAQWFPQQFHDYVNTLSDEEAETLSNSLEYARKYNKLSLYLPYGHLKTLDIPGWSKKAWQTEFHANQDKERMLMCANGVGKCASINTYINTPRGEVRIRDLKRGDKVYSWDNGMVVEPIGQPFRKQDAQMFRLFTESGQWVEVTGKHQIFDGTRFSSCESLLKSVPCLPVTNLECARLILLSDALRWLKKRPDFRFDYQAYSRLCDGQLLDATDTSLDDLPSRAGVLKRIPAWSHWGDRACKYIDSLQRFFCRPSIAGFYHHAWGQALIEDPIACNAFESSSESIRIVEQLQSELVLRLQEDAQQALDQGEFSSCVLSPNGGYNSIVAYQDLGVQPVWDFEVRRTHNYIAGGMINHNSISGAFETALHMTGLYPDWWEGYKFTAPPKFWIGSITNEVQKDYIQAILLGDSSDFGTGFIPKTHMLGKPTTRQCGISGVIDTFKVRHVSGGISIGQFKTYEQGWRKWQAAAPNGIWLDEEPNEGPDQKPIFSECQTRLIRTSGILYVTYTPLLGQTDLTEHFSNPKAKSISCVTATWDDAPHLKKEDKDRLVATYPEHEREARTLGVPMLGEGRVFTTNEADIKIAPFDIPPHWARLKGIDFGIDHPCASAEIAWDRDKDIIYLIRTWKKKGADAAEHADQTSNPNPWVPVSWPHDGAQREKSSGKQLKDIYRDKYGVRLLSLSARYNNDKGGGQPVEPIVMEVNERARTGGFRVFSTCTDFLDEYRNYHRKNGVLTKTRDDVLKATFYAIMMRRYAITMRINYSINQPPRAFSTA